MIQLNGLDKDGQAQVSCDDDTLTPFIWHALLFIIEWFMQTAQSQIGCETWVPKAHTAIWLLGV
jgi:hypothetical protein